MQEQINALLYEVAFKIGTLRKANELFSDRLAPDFNVFDFLRTDEMGLSRCIASLLNPTGTHGQGSVFLKEFLARIDKSLPETRNVIWATTDMDECQVTLETQANGQRRIDVYLKFKHGEVIGIENKPWAGDQENQLNDYADFIEKETGNGRWLLVYLCNGDPSTFSITKEKREALEKAGSFIWIDYEEIIEWLEFCANKAKASVVRMFIEELAKFIRIQINGDLDMSEEKEIRNLIIGSAKNLESAFHVFNSIRSVKEELLKGFYGELKQRLNVEGFDLVWDESMSKNWKGYSGFGVKFSKEHNLYLRFEFNSSGLHDLLWGIRRENDSIKDDVAIWSEISAVMNKFGSAGQSEWWPWWNWIDKYQELGQKFRHWDTSETPWAYMLPNKPEESNLAYKITELATRVRNAFGDKLNLLSMDIK